MPATIPSALALASLGTELAGSSTGQYLIFSGAMLLVAVMAVVWALNRRKRRKRKRKARARLNPTRAETGGLPPLRDESEVSPEELQP